MKSRMKTVGSTRPYGGFGFSLAGSRERSAEYACVSRFRQRRLLTFLLRHDFHHTYKALLGETDVFMSLPHLLRLVREGLWSEAISYLSRFLRSDRLMGAHGRVLFHFLRVHKGIADVIAGADDARSLAVAVDQCFVRSGIRSHALIKLRDIFSSLLYSTNLRASLDLVRMRDKVALIIHDLVYQTPELKDHMSAAGGPMKPQNVLPVGFGYASFRVRRPGKKPGRSPPSVVAGLYLRKKKMLPSSPSCHSQGLTRESLIKAKELLVDLVDKSLEAGKLHPGCPLQSAFNKGAPVSQVTQTNFGTFTRWLPHYGISSVGNDDLLQKATEWMFYLTEECLEAWPDLRQGYPLQFSRKNGPALVKCEMLSGKDELPSMEDPVQRLSISPGDELHVATRLPKRGAPKDRLGLILPVDARDEARRQILLEQTNCFKAM